MQHSLIDLVVHFRAASGLSDGNKMLSVLLQRGDQDGSAEGGAAWSWNSSLESKRKFTPKKNSMGMNPRGRSINSASIGGYRLPGWDSLGVARGNNLFPKAPPFDNFHWPVCTPSLLKSTYSHTHAWHRHVHRTRTRLRLTHHMICRLTWCKKYKRQLLVFPQWSKALGGRSLKPSVAFKWFSTLKCCFPGCMYTCFFFSFSTQKIQK